MNINYFLKLVKPFTMTSNQRIESLFHSLEYIRKKNIQGDIVECGVWKGGNILGCLEYVSHYKINKKIWLYDTFSGMTKTTTNDIDYLNNSGSIYEGQLDCSLDEVKKNIKYETRDKNNIEIVEGDICQTLLLENNIPKKISLLRLDTDWYESTRIEIEKLFPILEEGGVLIIDDYGHWQGSKMAINQYFESINYNPEFESIDYTGVKLIKK